MRPATPLVGIGLMAAASLAVPFVDGIAKHLSAEHSPFLVAWSRYFGSALIVSVLFFGQGGHLRELRKGALANTVRTVFIVGAMTTFLFAIVEIPLATGLGGYFVGPIIASVLSVIFLRERLTPNRLIGGGLGVIGALLIIKPGVEVEFGSLLAVISGLLFGGYLIATRAAATTAPPLVALYFQVCVGTLLLTPFAIATWSWFSASELLLVAVMGLVSTACHFMVIAAFRHAEASVISPLAYLELISAFFIGYFAFSEIPGTVDVIGIFCILASGLVISLYSRKS
jgi:drug/metabolite transporter (DMT)-like permease